MKCKWDATTPIEIMFCKIDDGQAFATSGNIPYMDTQIVCMAYNLAFQSSKIKDACQDWRQRTANDQTWDNFVPDFKASHLDIQHEATSESVGFQAHFSEQAIVTKEIRTSNITNQSHMENFAQVNLETTEQVSSLLDTITKLQNKVRTVSTNRQQNKPRIKDERKNGGAQRGGGGRRLISELKYPDITRTYCWSHGGSIAANHNRTNCNYKKPGHNDADTFASRHSDSTFCCKT